MSPSILLALVKRGNGTCTASREFVSPEKLDVVCPLSEGPEVRWDYEEIDGPNDAGMNLEIFLSYLIAK